MVLAESSSVPAGAPNPYEWVSPYQRFDRRSRSTQYADTARLYPQSTMQESDSASVKIEMFDCLSISRSWFYLSSRESWTPRILHRCFGKHILVPGSLASFYCSGGECCRPCFGWTVSTGRSPSPRENFRPSRHRLPCNLVCIGRYVCREGE
jgi:hypothetical protein